jgi:hypothetical protein
MMVAMVAAWPMQVPVYQIIDMVAMRDGMVSAAGTVLMSRFVAGTGMVRRAGRPIIA